jgi:hypothetical protein
MQRVGQRLNGGAWIEIALADGRVLAGVAPSPVLAARVAARLVTLTAKRSLTRPARRWTKQVIDGELAGQRLRRSLSSALLPGLGQWRQGRFAMALAWFVPWAALLVFLGIPLLWTLVEPYTAVGASAVAMVLGAHWLLAAGAAIDCWYSESRPRH